MAVLAEGRDGRWAGGVLVVSRVLHMNAKLLQACSIGGWVVDWVVGGCFWGHNRLNVAKLKMAENGDACVCVCPPVCICVYGVENWVWSMSWQKGGAGGRALWVLGGGSASTAKDESRQFCQLSGGWAWWCLKVIMMFVGVPPPASWLRGRKLSPACLHLACSLWGLYGGFSLWRAMNGNYKIDFDDLIKMKKHKLKL